MKKSIFILAAFAFVASSCTKTEVIEDTPKKGINFSAYTAKPTRAAQTDVTTANLDAFQVTAIGNGATYFDNVTFSKNTVWESNPEYFWPAYPLNFYAYNTPEKGVFTIVEDDIVNSGPKLTFKTSHVLAEQEDLVAAHALNQLEGAATGANHSLPITFNHYLTQVIVKAKNSNSNYDVKVYGVKIANMADEGTYTFGNPGGTMAATTGHVNSASSVKYVESFGEKELDENPKEVMTDGTGGKGRWYLIPQNVTPWNRVANVEDSDMTNTAKGTYLALKVKITTKDGAQIYPKTVNQTAWMAVPTGEFTDAGVQTNMFAQGKKYTIILDFFGNGGAGYVDPEDPSDLDGNNNADDDKGKQIIGGPIRFDANVNTWDGNDVEITISL